MTYIGVDPGKKGSLALLENGAVSIIPFSEDTYIDVLSKVDPRAAVCCLEHVGAMPGQGFYRTCEIVYCFFITGIQISLYA